MPRVSVLSVNKKQYMIDDLPFWLSKEARKKGLYQKDLAAAIDITPQAFGQRLKKKDGKRKDTFSYGELLALFKFLDVSGEDKQKLLTL